MYLNNDNVSGITCDVNNDEMIIFLKVLILLYADDTVIFSDNESGLQHALNVFEKYCSQWKLKVNVFKTKVVVFCSGRRKEKLKFCLNSKEIEIVQEYKYLGILLGQSGSFVVAKKHIADQANKALFSLLRKIRKLSLPFDIQIDLFNKMITPILLYGCEVWGFGNFDILERVQLRFYKYIFNLKNSTPSAMIYGEIGVMPVAADIQSMVVSFWSKLIATDLSEHYKLSGIIYNVIYALHDTTGFKFL